MHVFTSAPHEIVLILIIQVALLLLTARALGEISRRFGQPSVVGELLAGIILGPSLLSGLIPAIGQWMVPNTPEEGYLLELIGMFGAIFLLIITGLETDIPLIKRYGKTAFSIGAGGLILPFLGGFAMSTYLPDSLVANPDSRLAFDLFVATCMAISSIPVVGKVLIDLNLIRRDLGQTILASGMLDDTAAWVLLSIILGFAGGEAITAGTFIYAVGKIVAFFVLSFTAGRWLIKHGLHFVQDEVKSPFAILTFVVIVALLLGAAAQAIKVEAVLGAFVAGIIFGTMRRLPQKVIHQLEAVAFGIFAPIFFAVSGLKVNVISLLHPSLLLISGIVLTIAVLGKMAGAYAGARLVGQDHWSSLAYGSALNARGAVEIIIASVGLSMGILSQNMYSIIVLMAMATSLMAPLLLQWTVGKMPMSDEERERLDKEEMESKSVVASIRRVLLSVRPKSNNRRGDETAGLHQIELNVLNGLHRNNPIAVTLLAVAPKEDEQRFKTYLEVLADALSELDVEIKVVQTEKPTRTILDEAQNDYDLMILEAAEEDKNKTELFNPVIDELVRLAPCPTVIVQPGRRRPDWKLSRVLVPTTGSQAEKNAAELGMYMVDTSISEIYVLYTAEGEVRPIYDYLDRNKKKQDELEAAIFGEYKMMADAMGVEMKKITREGQKLEEAVFVATKDNKIDLVIVGTNIHPGTGELYLGRGVENILYDADCPVLIFNT